MLSFAAQGAVAKLCWLPKPEASIELPLKAIVRNSLEFQGSFHEITESMHSSRVDVAEDDDNSRLLFNRYSLVPGDCIHYSSTERFVVAVHSYKRVTLPSVIAWFLGTHGRQSYLKQTDVRSVSVVPAIITNAKTERRLYGLIPTRLIERLTPVEQTELKTDELMAYAEAHAGDFTLLYLFCPPNRDGTCDLQIVDHGKKVKVLGKDFTLPLLARSKVNQNIQGYMARVREGLDTPQGIYPVWAVIQNGDARMGAQPQINLDFCDAPLNSGRVVGRDSAILDRILPPGHAQDYWAQEFALAHAFGRCGIRIHAQNLKPASDTPEITSGEDTIPTTLGCISAGTHMQALLDELERLGVFESSQYKVVDPPRWRISLRAGKTFLIVKDR